MKNFDVTKKLIMWLHNIEKFLLVFTCCVARDVTAVCCWNVFIWEEFDTTERKRKIWWNFFRFFTSLFFYVRYFLYLSEILTCRSIWICLKCWCNRLITSCNNSNRCCLKYLTSLISKCHWLLSIIWYLNKLRKRILWNRIQYFTHLSLITINY